MEGNDQAQAPLQVPPSEPAIRLGAWNYYFLAKFLLVWRELIGIHPLENLAFAAVLLAPVQSARLRLIRNLLAVPAAIALLYDDSWLPPFSRVLSQANLLAGFSPAYLVELIGRFINWPVVAALIVVWAAYAMLARYVRIGVVVVAALVATQLFQGTGKMPAPETATAAGGKVASPDAALQAFYAAEAKRSVKLTRPADTVPPFDLFFIHICSLSWDDLQATDLTGHPLWQGFDIVLKRFNSASSYSGPAAIRLLRAPCGQQVHAMLFAPAQENCYLIPSLQQAGFEPNLLLNHDGHFDDFLGFVRKQGVSSDPMPLDGIPIPLRAFDDTAIHDDGAVLSRWLERRQKSSAPRVAAYYNTISLHDGNRLVADPRAASQDTYKIRLAKLLDDLDGFMQQLQSSGRRAVIVLIPEHGAALRGDKMQIAGLREIASPAITLAPVGVKVVGPGVSRIGEQARIEDSVSYLGLSHIVARMLQKPPFDAAGFAPADYTADMPLTGFVAENGESVMQKLDGKYLLRPDGKAAWREYADGR